MKLPFRRHGIALLLVLAAVMLVSTAAVAAIRWRVITHASDLDSVHQHVCQSLLTTSKDIIEAWLREESRSVVLPSDVAAPGLAAFRAETEDWSLTITAWDLLGMAPANNETLLSAASSVAVVPGLEELAFEPDLAWDDFWRTHHGSLGVFPSAESQASLAAVVSLPDSTPSPRGPRSGNSPSQDPSARLNVQTAPRWLLEAAMNASSRGGLDAIMEARDCGERSPLPSAADSRGTDDTIRFVSSSDRWSFRVDARSGRVVQSHWLTYQAGDGWELRERYEIPE